MAVMSEKRVRHLPVVEDGKLAGILSMRDLICARAEKAETEVHYLRDYISGGYPR